MTIISGPSDNKMWLFPRIQTAICTDTWPLYRVQNAARINKNR